MSDESAAKILYVEDHPPAQLLMQAIVSEMTSHDLTVVGSGEQARRIAASLAPDLYIIDLDLPDIDGISLAQALRAIHTAPVLLVSAYAEAVKDSTLNASVHAYLAKPLDPDRVAEAIQQTINEQ